MLITTRRHVLGGLTIGAGLGQAPHEPNHEADGIAIAMHLQILVGRVLVSGMAQCGGDPRDADFFDELIAGDPRRRPRPKPSLRGLRTM